MKTLTIVINAENFSECINELVKEKNSIFQDISKKLTKKNKAKGYIEKDRSNIRYSFCDEAEL